MERIGPYLVIAELGRGGMGAVYRVRDAGGRDLALKLLTAGREASPHQQVRFRREAEALAKIDHPGVVRLVDLGQERGAPYLVMEFHEGGSLEERIAAGPLPPGKVAELGLQLAAALAAAHAHGVLHRDLKPGNVLIARDGRGLLTDFGIAKDLERAGQTQELTRSGAFLGTPGYWAPEQAAGKEVGPASDVYGLGAVLYAALTGRPPIVAESLVDALAKTEHEPPPPIRSLRPVCPELLERIVLRCLAKRPEDRWRSAESLGDALDVYLIGGAEPARRGSIGALGALLLVALVGVVALVSLFLAPKGSPRASSRARRLSPPSATPQVSSEDVYRRALQADAAGRSQQGLDLYREAADLGHGRAAFALGLAYRDGEGVAADPLEALRWFRRAAAEGVADAFHEVGRALHEGLGTERDEEEGVRCYSAGAALGSPRAMSALATCYLRGCGATSEPELAVRWLRLAVAADDPGAGYSLGQCYRLGIGVPVDLGESLRLTRRSADLGDLKGMHQFAAMTLGEPDLTPEERALAVEWLRRAADAGDVQSIHTLGYCYEAGIGVPPDRAEATRLFLRAARLGDLQSMLSAGLCLEKGLGAPADPAEALFWIRRASEGGLAEATRHLARLHTEGIALPRDLPTAFELYRRAGNAGSPAGLYIAASCYEHGEGTEVDLDQAATWYRRAAACGDEHTERLAREALERLGR